MDIKRTLKRMLPLSVNLELKNCMDYIKQEKIEGLCDSKRKVFFCDAATYDNLGDQAIAYAMSLFLQDLVGKDRYVEIPQSQILKKWKSLKQVVRPDDIICLSGGGNMGEMYPRFEAIRRKVIKTFPNNRIIIFPQTIDYSNDLYGKRELKKSINIYNRHSKLVICARESKSYKFMKSIYKNVYLVPDIVLYLSGKMKLQASKSSGKIGICLREDAESVLDTNKRTALYDKLDLYGFRYSKLTTMCDENIEFLNAETRERVIKEKLNQFKQYDCIITDRLHGMIFSLIAEIPCLAFDNSNHKVFGVCNVIADSVSGLKKVDLNDDLAFLIKKMETEKVKIDLNKLNYELLNNYIETEGH